jgi:hypothetical protein
VLRKCELLLIPGYYSWNSFYIVTIVIIISINEQIEDQSYEVRFFLSFLGEEVVLGVEFRALLLLGRCSIT